MGSRLPYDVVSELAFFFLVKQWKNADPYITKPSSLSSPRECNDKLEGTVFS